MSEPVTLPRLVAVTRELSGTDDLLSHASAELPLAWLRRGEGMIGAGPELLRLDVLESGRLDAMSNIWKALCAGATVVDPLGLAGTGLVAFVTGAFDDDSTTPSTLIVPTTVIGRRNGRAWVTTVTAEGTDHPEATSTAIGPHWSATLGPGLLDPVGHSHAVEQALAAIARGEVQKVVIARDLIGTLPADSDLRRLVRALTEGYPDTWTFAVDGLIGASPETLVTVSDGALSARVLAGTRGRGADADGDTAISSELAASEKDLDEHRYAVASVLESLRPYSRALASAAEPFLLKLPNVWHLATDVDGTLDDSSTGFDLVRALHPTAAVAGTPTAAAKDVIARLEPFDRGRYSGPVGWIDQNGNGEWAIALRCAQIGEADDHGTRPVTAHAGGGIVAGSEPEAELLETRVKFRPIVDALA